MFVVDGGSGPGFVYSASDLAAAARCEYALLRAFDHKLGRGPRPETDDDLMVRTAELGDAHERRRLDELRRRFGEDVVCIGRPQFTVAGLSAAAEATRRAIAARAPVVYQAAMFDGRFVGFADFVVKDGDRYQVSDTKLARSAKVTALLQLASYADVLAAAGVPIAPEAELRLGDGTSVRYPIRELVPVYRRQRAHLQQLLDEHHARGRPVAWTDEHVRACFRCPECLIQVRASDDLLLVAGMRVSQRAKLLDAGIGTLTELAAGTADVPDMPARIATALTAQARLQVRERDTGVPQFEVADPQPLGQLPEPDDGDLFFDFEGDPLWTATGADWGLEYLFGVVEGTGRFGPGRFRPRWAHDRAGERQAFTEFLAMVAKRRRRYPKMHIYHYAAYEKTALLRLAGRYGVGEDEVDQLLRDNVLVDLYPVVRKSIRVGAESYGLKALEPLYLGPRQGEVTTATDSITEYARYCQLRDTGHTTEAAAVLDAIAEYNRADCESTRALRDWLLMRAFEAGVTHLTRPSITGDAAVETPDALGRALAEFAGDAATERRDARQTAVALVAAARGYHKREAKPFWWGHFDRLNSPVEEWADTSGVFVVTDAEVITDWHLPPRARKQRRHVRLVGDLAGGVLENQVFALYDPPAPRGMVGGDPDRRGSGGAEIIAAVETDGVPTEVVIRERTGDDGEPFSQLPIALAPGQPIHTGKLVEAIESVAGDVAAGLAQSPPRLPRSAVMDVLLREDPRTRGGTPLPHGGDDVEDITAGLLELDSSYLAVHGPPGTGKTYTAATVIAALVNDHHWRIGVVAQSHAVVENLLGCVTDAKVDPLRVAKKKSPYGPEAITWQEIGDNDYAAFIAGADGCVVGGTAWDFANGSRIPPGSLDLLVIDEAGQFSLANTIAVSPAANNLLLLGDPQQLPQVSTGTHPEPVDSSALGWLIEQHATLPGNRGYFLAHSYRMHPAVCGPVSALSYGGRLRSNGIAAARHLDGHPAGLRTLLVDHDGNATDSPEEARAIVGEIRRLIGAQWSDESGTRALTAQDVLLVAPYNAQVLRLRSCLLAAGLQDVPVGTVDRFQGRQAPVVFVSMTASAVDDVPRGMSFLLNRNRLNVAISRAKYAAVIVRSPTLTEFLPSTPDGLIELGAFLSLDGCDTPAG